jgi:hypothetical protein
LPQRLAAKYMCGRAEKLVEKQKIELAPGAISR